ncbi:hypothetical protein H5410_064494 [Solanum commersonii]|uniref:Uncharacterized protein n=1 Tax=Solanum commersonii TaxID=4109 RepID=A0A9J5VZX0_SOLCO|nr:hypothetical protein H5410_064494 [Solanum commersonii]
MLYEAECWPVKNSSSKYESGGNKDIKMREARLRWFGHVNWRYAEAPMSKCERLVVMGFRKGSGSGRPVWD